MFIILIAVMAITINVLNPQMTIPFLIIVLIGEIWYLIRNFKK